MCSNAFSVFISSMYNLHTFQIAKCFPDERALPPNYEAEWRLTHTVDFILYSSNWHKFYINAMLGARVLNVLAKNWFNVTTFTGIILTLIAQVWVLIFYFTENNLSDFCVIINENKKKMFCFSLHEIILLQRETNNSLASWR